MSGNKNQKQGNGYTIASFPREQQLVVDASRLGKRKHSFHGLVEVDVTNIRRHLREHKTRAGERLSFTTATGLNRLLLRKQSSPFAPLGT